MDGLSRDEINRRLDEIQQQLWKLSPDEFAARFALQRERDALRDRVRVSGREGSTSVYSLVATSSALRICSPTASSSDLDGCVSQSAMSLNPSPS